MHGLGISLLAWTVHPTNNQLYKVVNVKKTPDLQQLPWLAKCKGLKPLLSYKGLDCHHKHSGCDGILQWQIAIFLLISAKDLLRKLVTTSSVELLLQAACDGKKPSLFNDPGQDLTKT